MPDQCCCKGEAGVPRQVDEDGAKGRGLYFTC